MVDFTLEELEKYRQWVESLKDSSSVDASLESQREAAALAEELARSQKAAAKPLSTFGESLSGVGELKSKLPSGISSPAQESAKVFEEAGGAMPKSVAQSMVDAQSKPGKSAEEAAEILAPKELPAVREEKQLVKSLGTSLEDVQTPKSKAPEVLQKDNAALIKASDATDDVIDVTPKSSSPLLSRLSKLFRLGGAGLGAAAAASDLSKGNASNALIDLAQGAGIFAGGAATIPLEIFRTSDLNSNEDEALAKIRLKARQEALTRANSSGIGDLRFAEANAIKRDSEPPRLGMGDLRVSDQPALEAQLKKLEELKKSKKPQPSPAALTAPMQTEASPESTLMRAIESESLKKPETEIDYMAELEQAKKQRNAIQLLAMLGKAGETISTGITGVVPGGVVTKPASGDFYANLAKMGETPVEDFGTKYSLAGKEEERKRQKARRDPASSESRFARELLKSQGISVPENATAEALEKYSSQLTNILNQREAREARAASAREAREARAASARERALDREALLESKLDEKKLASAMRIAPKVQNKQYETFSELRSQASIMKNALKNPNPTADVAIIYGFVKALDPKSAVREGEIDFVQLGRSVPTKITQYFKRTFSGEILPPKARQEMADYISQREQQAKNEWELSAKPYLNQADKAGIDRELVAPGTTFAQEQKRDPKIEEYAKTYSISYEKAESILRARGYGQ